MKKFWKEWKGTIFLFLAIAVLALFLRIYKLTDLPVFVDEAIYVRWAQVMRVEPSLRFLPLSDGKQPLFMWSVIPFLKLFSDPVFSGRMVSVFSGLGTIIGIFLLAFYLFKSKKVALIASLIYAISPFGVFFDRMALVDSMLTMFGVWTFLGALVTARTLRLDTAMLTGFSLGGALLTKSPALFFVILLPTSILFLKFPKKERALQLIKLFALWSVTLAIAYAMYNILRLGPNFHLIFSRNYDYVYPISHLWTNPKDPFIFYFDRAIEWLWILGPSVLLIFIGFGFFANIKRNLKEVSLLLAWGLFPILIQAEFAKVFTARYILFSLPPLFVLASSSFLLKKEKISRLLIFGIIIFIFHSLTIDKLLLTNVEAAPLPRGERSGYLEEWTAGTGIKEVSELIREEWERDPDTNIVVGTEGYFGTLPDALQAYLNDIPDITVIGIGLGLKEVPTSLIESRQAGNKTYFVVNNTRFLGEAQELGLELIAAYPKAVRLDGSREALLFYEVTERALRNL